MLSYFPRRMLLIIPTFLDITLLVFTITRFVPAAWSSACCCRRRSRKTGPAAPVAARGEHSPTNRLKSSRRSTVSTTHAGRLLGLVAEAGGAGSRGASTRYYEPVGSHQRKVAGDRLLSGSPPVLLS